MEVKALDHVSISIEEKDYASIMGPSGSGKSTLLNIIGLLDNHDNGIYKIGDLEIKEMNETVMPLSYFITYRSQVC